MSYSSEVYAIYRNGKANFSLQHCLSPVICLSINKNDPYKTLSGKHNHDNRS